jgi:hypothetical protein
MSASSENNDKIVKSLNGLKNEIKLRLIAQKLLNLYFEPKKSRNID